MLRIHLTMRRLRTDYCLIMDELENNDHAARGTMLPC